MLKKIELLANIAIILIALLLGVVLVKRYLLPQEPAAPSAAAPVEARIQPGTKVELPGVEWKGGEQTLVLVLSETCHFCTESAGFYQKLAQAKAQQGGQPRLIAVLPQEVSKGQAYLSKLGVSVDTVMQAPMSAVGVRGTPTLILVDGAGLVKESWVGKLPPEKEAEVMSRLRPERAGL